MKRFKQYLNEGQLSIDMKNMDRKDKKELIDLLQSLKVKRKFNLSFASTALDRWIKLKAYYLDLDDLRDYLKDKGYKWKDGKMWAGKPMDITMESINEARRPRRGEETIQVTWDTGKPAPGEIKEWEDEYNVYVEKLRRNDIWISGERKDLYTWLEEAYGMESKDIEKEYPELF